MNLWQILADDPLASCEVWGFTAAVSGRIWTPYSPWSCCLPLHCWLPLVHSDQAPGSFSDVFWNLAHCAPNAQRFSMVFTIISMITMINLGWFEGVIWVCLKIGVYSQWNSHLIGIMISKTIGFRGTNHFQTHPFLEIQGLCGLCVNGGSLGGQRYRLDLPWFEEGESQVPKKSRTVGSYTTYMWFSNV